MDLSSVSIHAWLENNRLVSETGKPISYRDHLFLFDVISDMSPKQVWLKAAQVGGSTAAILKTFWLAKFKKMDVIYCVDLDTEVLSKRGFIKGNELSLEDEIITLGLDGVARWSKVEEVFRKKVRTETYRYKARNFDAVTTSNHRWIVQDYKGRLEFKESRQLKGVHRFIPKRIPNNPTKKEILSDSYIELLAWVFSEGYYCKQKDKKDWSIVICQSHKVNPDKCNEIRRILWENGTKWKEYTNKFNDTTNFRFAYSLGRKIKKDFPLKIPTHTFAISLSRRQCRLFIETFVQGDGWIDSSGTSAIAQKNKDCVDVLTMISALGGYAPSVVPPGKNGAYTVRLTQFDTVQTDALNPLIQIEEIEVWCPRTKQGTFYAKRGGRCYWTGNTLPSDGDVRDFVGGKVNRLVDNNPILQKYVADRDTIEQKKLGDNVIYYRGTFTNRAALMVSADLVVADEVDRSKQDIIAQYSSRLQHSKYGWEWYFSNPSSPANGVGRIWQRSDQKHWFITCGGCEKKQYLSWPDSIDPERRVFQCKGCKKELTDDERRVGKWHPRVTETKPEYSGYWISLLMAPWISAEYILNQYENKDEEYFTNFVLGLPYVGSGNTVDKSVLLKNLIDQDAPTSAGRIVIGVDTGTTTWWVAGNKEGLLDYGSCKGYDDIERLLKRFPRAIAVFDAGGDLMAPRELQEKYRGRIFLCSFSPDRKSQQILRWGEGNETGHLTADRNRLLQMVVDEFNDERIPIYGKEAYWEDYFSHWGNVYRTSKENALGVEVKSWERSGPDHWVLSSAYWRAGLDRFGGAEEGGVFGGSVTKDFRPAPETGYDGNTRQTLVLPDPDGE